MTKPAPTQTPSVPDGSFGERLLGYFYPVHYQLGMEMEQAMSQGLVDRMQAAMLWLVHSRAGDGWVLRRDVVQALSTWFELSEAKVSRLLKGLSSDPLPFLDIAESPNSGREKVIRLTSAGTAFVEGMAAAAERYLDRRFAHLAPERREATLTLMANIFLPPPP